MNQRPLAPLLTAAQATLLHSVLTSSTCQEPYTDGMGDCTSTGVCLEWVCSLFILLDMGYSENASIFQAENKWKLLNQTFEEEHHSVKVHIRYGRIYR